MCTSVSLDAVCQIGDSRQCGRVGEGEGGEGGLCAAGEGGDDSFLPCPEEGAGEPCGSGAGVIFICGDDSGDVGGWMMSELLILLVCAWWIDSARTANNR